MITPPLVKHRPMTDIADVVKPAPPLVWFGRVVKVATETICQAISAQFSFDYKSQLSRKIDFYTTDDKLGSKVPLDIQEMHIKRRYGEMPFYVSSDPGSLFYTYGMIEARKFKVLMQAFNECREKFPDDIISVGPGFALLELAFDMIPGKKVCCFDKDPMKLAVMNITQASIPEDMDTILPEDCSKAMLMMNYPRGYVGETLKEFANRGGKTVFMTLDNSLAFVHFMYEPDEGKAAIAEIHKLLKDKKSADFVVELSDGNYFLQPFVTVNYSIRLGPTYAVCFNGPENFQSALTRASEGVGIPMEVKTYGSVPWNTINDLALQDDGFR